MYFRLGLFVVLLTTGSLRLLVELELSTAYEDEKRVIFYKLEEKFLFS